MDWLTNDHLAIPVDSSSVHFIKTPCEFHSTLKNKIANSKKRIILAALYLGTSLLELDFIDALNKVANANPDIEIGILFDYFRSTRTILEGESKCSSLKLLQKLEKANIRLFYHPDMSGIIKHVLPERVNELVGLQHMKFFIFDDSIIISGANLSDQYFTNRQDRYLLIENNPTLVDFFVSLFEVISSCSLNLDNTSGKIIFNGEDNLNPLISDSIELRKEILNKLSNLFSTFKRRVAQETKATKIGNTFICPFLQMSAFNVNQEMNLLSKLFSYTESNINVTLSTGYFNLYDNYAEEILKYTKYPLKVLLASPEANGFYGASGLSGYIPSLYVHSLREFYDRCRASGNSIDFYEYTRPNWSFHAKGLWIETVPQKSVATIIGSSNFGYRSTFRDLEAQVLLVTEDDLLIKKILEEKQNLMENCNAIDLATFLRKDYFVPRWIKFFSRIFRNFS